MKLSALSSLSVLSLFIGTLSLVGCGGSFTTPVDNSAAVPDSVAGPPIQGSVYGGHAPIQGAHVYLAQPGTTGYGTAATSLLGTGTTTTPGGYPLTANISDPNVPVGAEYVTTDANGEFNLTGAYVCAVGEPVYIYAYGGNIGTTPGTPVTDTGDLNISSATVTNAGSTYTYTFTYTTTNSPTTPLAAGDTVNLTLTGGTGTHKWTNLPSVTNITILSSTQFRATGATDVNGTGTGTGTYTYTVTPTNPATNNNNIVQLATLGNCPSSGNFSTAGNGALSYVYLNEVSTVATAYTFQPFTLVTNNDAWHIGSPSTTQALLGIANAANTAAQLYNIQGGTNVSTSGDGEGHLANVFTVNGNGIVPEANIDSLANILAACVDSVPTTVGVPTTTCSNLFTVARDDGTTTGTEPIDTATAAINISRYPAGNNSSTNVDATYASDLFAIANGTVPYVPDLSNAPNDWTIAIMYPVAGSVYATKYTGVTNAYFGKAESIAIDALGQIWITGQESNSIVRLNNMGVIQPSTAQNYLNYIPGYVSVDGSNNAWTGNANCGPANSACSTGTPIFLAGSNGVFNTTYGTDYESAYTNIADYAGDDYFFTEIASANYGMYEYPSGAGTGSTPNYYSLATSGFGTTNGVAHGAIDASHDFWLTSETDSSGTADYQIAKVTSTGTNVWTYNTGTRQPEFVAIDASGNGWIPSQTAAGPIYKITSAGAHTSLTSGTTGASLYYPFGSAVDGNGNVWVTNRCGAYNTCVTPVPANASTLIEINGTGTNGTINNAISPPTNYLPESQYPSTVTTFTRVMADPLNLAIDPSGNIWITNYAGNLGTPNGNNSSVTEIVGAAAPVVTPLSVAAGTNKLGTKP